MDERRGRGGTAIVRLRFAVPLIALVLTGAAAFDPARIAGRYGRHFQNARFDGSKFWSDDVLEIEKLDRSRSYFRARVNFYNGHICAISGIAHAEPGALVYRAAKPSIPNDHCVLRLSERGTKVRLDDAGSCHSFCGARGNLNGIEFDRESRRPITYVARLKASREFRDALAEEREERR
jgi:hypothetical protein